VQVRTLRAAVHSGTFGGAAPDALTALARLLATLHDERGDVAVDGLASGRSATLELPAERVRAEAGMVDGVQFVGTGPMVDRLWTRSALSVLGIDAPSVREAANALVPVVRAKISIRLAPGDHPRKAFAALCQHLEAHRPWGAAVTVELEGGGEPCVIDTSGPHYQVVRAALRAAWDGEPAVEIGVGGSIPAIATFRAAFPDATIVVTGVADPDTGAHGPNESLHLGEFGRVCLAEAFLLAGLAAPDC
jgi:acetylornithine deacetylase/succinyl-diaminopimelate desuccinylase-like protein